MQNNNFNGIEITDIKIRKISKVGKLIGEASITLNDCLVIHGIRIIQAEDRRILAFPSKQIPKNGMYKDIVHPITSGLRAFIEDAIFEIFDKAGAEE